MSKILSLWATPRATSTAFELVMANRGDFECFHEPYNEAFYYGEDRRLNRYFDDDPTLSPTDGLTYTSVTTNLMKQQEQGPVFIKEFAYSVMHLADGDFLDRFQHTFLIRDPEKVLTSMHARWPDITLGEIGFEELHTLFDRIADRDGVAPPVVDSDEFVKFPHQTMQAYCDAIGIPFMAEALSWKDQKEAHANRDITWNDDRHGFHDSLRSSTEIGEQKRDYPPIDSDDRLLEMYHACVPHYQAMFEHRTGAVGTT